ncbi:hypothetical protein ACGF12_29980 [Kitasatospora sp. NPDC048296]|uniref:hypothetical protein n=1 Tax=Kitasatospora sp. NPDC048296 TaxID=3364048 RepID=UPI003711654A
MARILAGSLAKWIARRPLPEEDREAARLSHSSDVRQLVMILAGMEVFLAVLVDRMFPPALRPAHLTLEALLILASFGLVAAMVRHPHLVSPSRMVLRTGVLGGITLPRHAVRSASRTMRTVEGRGVRQVPGESRSLACSVGSSVNFCIELAEPLSVELGKHGTVEASTIYISVDSPEAALQAIRNSTSPG